MTDANKIWNEYSELQSYLEQRNIYEKVKTNENFYDGRQWEGVKSDSLPKPVINIIQRVVKYFIATLSTNDIAISMTPFSSGEDDSQLIEPIKDEIERIIETAKVKEKSRLIIRNAAVDGSGFMVLSFDPEVETGQDIKGTIKAQLVDNTNVYFGNPYTSDIQGQPFIIIALRQNLRIVRQEARELGLDEDTISQIKPDSDTNQFNEDDASNLVTVLLRFEKVTKEIEEEVVIGEGDAIIAQTVKRKVRSIHFTKTTQNVVLIDDTDLGYTRYPVSCFGWDPIKNSYLYNSPITAVIPNQIFINKSYAIAQMYGLQSAFPKIVYDKNKAHIDEILNTTDPVAVANIDTMGKLLDFIKVPDFSNNILSLIDSVIGQTKECMGANDVSLGNVKPDNTSAIIALQESSNVPLEIQRQAFYEFWEDTIRNIIDVMSCTYGMREIPSERDGQKEMAVIDFAVLKTLNYDLKVDVGNGAQFSEISQINTLDKLLEQQIVDAETYVDLVPNKYIPGKGKILQHIQKQKEQIEQMQQMQNSQSIPNGNQSL